MLRKENAVCSVDDKNVDKVNIFFLEIFVNEQVLVQQSYKSIPRPLYKSSSAT